MLYWCLRIRMTVTDNDERCRRTPHTDAQAHIPLIETDEGLLFADRCDTCEDGRYYDRPEYRGKESFVPCPAGCVNGWKVRARLIDEQSNRGFEKSAVVRLP